MNAKELKIETLTSEKDVLGWMHDSVREGQSLFSLDLETTGLEYTDKIISACITGPHARWVATINPECLNALHYAPVGIEFLFHNAPFDLKMLFRAGVDLRSFKIRDTRLLSHLCDENISHRLGDLVKTYFQDSYKEEFLSKYKIHSEASEQDLKEYNAKDTSYTRLLWDVLLEDYEKQGLPYTLLEHTEKLQAALINTEIEGIRVDLDYLAEKGVEIREIIASLLPQMRSCVEVQVDRLEVDSWVEDIETKKTDKGKRNTKRPEFSFDSSKQLMQLLYDELKLPIQKNEKTKRPSVDSSSLETLKEEHELIPLLLRYREFKKLDDAYIKGTLERAYNGRIYPSFNVSGTKTGRISHSNPNLGQLPRAGGIRAIYRPDAGRVFISADFSQLEVCLSAHFTRDKNLLRIVENGESQHDITAEALGIERDKAKTVNFGMQYGASHYKISKVLGVNQKQGKLAYDKYWETYAGQKRIMQECADKVDRGEPIITPFGRRRRFETCKRAPWDSAYRQAWNALVQGTGADLTSRAFYHVDDRLRAEGYGRGVLTVHDEILIEVKKEFVKESEEILLSTMQKVGVDLNLSVTLKAESSGAMDAWLD